MGYTIEKGGLLMNTIIPVSDLKNNLDDILMEAHATAQPIFLTRNGYGDTVLMSREAYEKMLSNIEVFRKLFEAERNEDENPVSYTVEEVREMVSNVISNQFLP